MIHVQTGSLPPVYFLTTPPGCPAQRRAGNQLQRRRRPTRDVEGRWHGSRQQADRRDLIDAIKKDRQPFGSIYDARASLEMILSVYESHKLEKPVDLPLKIAGIRCKRDEIAKGGIVGSVSRTGYEGPASG